MKKNILAWACFLILVSGFAWAANTTHYNIPLAIVGGSQNSWGTITNSAFQSLDTQTWLASNGTTIGVNTTSSAADITLANPIASTQNITLTTTSKKLILPPMNVAASMVLGGQLYVTNAGSNAFDVVAQDGSTAVVTALTAGQSVQIRLLTNGTANGTFTVSGPYLTTVSGVINLGSTTTSANPQSSATATTGLYSTTSANVGVTIQGTSVGQFTSTGLNSTAIGATTSSTAIFRTTTAGTANIATATIAGGTINATSIGATTSSTALFSTATIGTLNTSGNASLAGTTTVNNLTVTGTCTGCGGGSSSITQNGYQTFSSGLIIQWGYNTPGSTSITNIVFPTAFLNNCFSVTVSVAGVSDGKRSAGVSGTCSTTGFSYYTGEGAAGNEAFPAYWIATGN